MKATCSSKIRRNVVVKGVLLYDVVFVLSALLDALDDRDLVALTGFPRWLVSSWRFKCWHLDDDLFTDSKKTRWVYPHQTIK